MKTIFQLFLVTVVIFSVFVVKTLTAQSQFSYPMKPGDIAVYKVTPFNQSSGGFPTVSYSIISGDKWRGNWDGNNDTVVISNLGILTVSKRNMVTSFMSAGSSYFTELWPYDIPAADSIYFYRGSLYNTDSVIHHVTRRFDTTIFNRTVRAYTIDNVATIADYFGVIRQIRNWGYRKDTLSLSSAVINGVKYNRDERTWIMQPLCIGNVYQYQYWNGSPIPRPFPRYAEIKIERDTIIAGDTYYITNSSDQSYYRETPTGIIQYDKFNAEEKLILPYNATVGVIVDSTRCFVADTSTQFLFSAMRHVMVLQTFDPRQNKFTCVEGIGITSTIDFGPRFEDLLLEQHAVLTKQLIGEYKGDLVYAKICGSEIGSYQIPPVLPLIYNIQIYPNPFRDKAVISFTILSPIQLHIEIYDHLGRKISNVYEGHREPGNYYQDFGSFGLNSGLYFCRITADGEVYTNKLLIIK